MADELSDPDLALALAVARRAGREPERV